VVLRLAHVPEHQPGIRAANPPLCATAAQGASAMKNQRRFTATSQTTIRDLQRILTQTKATSLKIEQDVMKGDVKVIFDRAGKRYTMTADTWKDSLDNLRAIGLTITYLYRALESYGVKTEEVRFDQIFDQLFGGFIATPDDSVLMLGSGRSAWFDVLGVKADATKADIRNAFRALSKIHHPDAGGAAEDFKRLRHAYDEGMKATKK
jgi:DnaJ-class molecular chaperone